MTTHFYGDGCDEPHGAPCEHDSLTGVDTNEGADKVWRCDVCGGLFRAVVTDGITRFEKAI